MRKEEIIKNIKYEYFVYEYIGDSKLIDQSKNGIVMESKKRIL